MKRRSLRYTVVAALLVSGLSLGASPAPSGAGVGDSFHSYLNLGSQVNHPVTHFVRNKSGSTWLNTWGKPTSTQAYRYYKAGTGHWTFERQQTSALPPGGKYFERFIFDNRTTPSASTWLYLDYASLNGDIDPNHPARTPSRCSSSNLDWCDFVKTPGQQWARNLTATAAQGTDSSHAILQWDASTFGPNEGHHFWQRNVLRHSTQSRLYGQIWKRDTWTTTKFKQYADIVHNAEAIGWSNPGTSSLAGVTLAPKFVYIVRQYSGCVTTASATPWHACEVFEDHVYAKNSSNGKLGEVLVVIGFTPRHDNWYQTVGEFYAVTQVMIARS